MKEIKEIIDLGRRLDELTFEVYSQFAKRDTFDPALIALWSDMAQWKKRPSETLEKDVENLCVSKHISQVE